MPNSASDRYINISNGLKQNYIPLSTLLYLYLGPTTPLSPSAPIHQQHPPSRDTTLSFFPFTCSTSLRNGPHRLNRKAALRYAHPPPRSTPDPYICRDEGMLLCRCQERDR